MYKAAHYYEERTKELGLTRLATLLKHMANCVNSELGHTNKILFAQFWRAVIIELNATKLAFDEYKEQNKSALEVPPPKEQELAPPEEEFKVPERKDSDEMKPSKRLSDL